MRSGGLNSTRLFFLALAIVDQTRRLCKTEAGLNMTHSRQVFESGDRKISSRPKESLFW
jgi:hypothetical protein